MKPLSYRSAALLLALLLLAGCSRQQRGDNQEIQQSASSTDAQLEAGDWVDDWRGGAYTAVALNGATIDVDGAGATAEGGVLTIREGGVYVLSGTLDSGQIHISAGKDASVRLVLSGADITASENAGIYCAQADKLVITLDEGTDNTVRDAADAFTYADADAQEPDAALFSKCDLTINGGGSLAVTAGFNNGIGTKDDLVITGGNFTVNAANHGIRGRDSLTVLGGSFRVSAGNDGFQSNNSSQDKGWILLEGGSFDITAGHDGIQAEGSLTVTGGSYQMTTGGGSEGSLPQSTEEDTSDSYKGLKAGGDLLIAGGSFTLDCTDDAIHTNSDARIDGGAFHLSSGDDGIHADGDLTISGGEIIIAKSYEGLEAFTMTLAGGTIDITATDDGINIAGGNDSGGGPLGPDSFAQNGDRWLLISGGHITVDAQGDGIDINGNGEMTGGEVYVNGPTGGGDAPLDYDGTFAISGGTLVAAGSSAMAQAPGDSSSQPSLMVYFSETQTAGTEISLLAGDDILVAFTPTKDFQCILVSAPAMTKGATYTLHVNGAEVFAPTLTDAVNAYSDTGDAASVFPGMGGGRGGFGGGMAGPPGGREQAPGGFGSEPPGDRGAPPDSGPDGPGGEKLPGEPGAYAA